MRDTYQVCAKCIMDTTDPEIKFDENGVCNHCRRYEERAQRELHNDEAGQEKLQQLVNEIKKKGKNREYDCIIGLSGGMDSTMVAYTIRRLGLRPLAVHLDNGWDSELAISNMKKTVKALNIDLYTYESDWEEFKNLQLSFLKASVPNAEIPSDHAIVASLYQMAAKNGIRYILTRSNIVTQGMPRPLGWGYDPLDLRYIKSIHKKFGENKLRSFPRLSLFGLIYYLFLKRIKSIPILNYIPYNKGDTIQFFKKELDWKCYGGKHYESIYTRFYQGYILPRKFNIDKRKAHLSTLICSGQITRKEALKEIQKDLYTEEDLKKDKEYVLKKLELTNEEFEKIMNLPIKSHFHYKSDIKWSTFLRFIRRIFKKKDDLCKLIIQ